MLNGFLGEGKTRQIAHWLSVKAWTSSTGRATAKRDHHSKAQRFSHELTLAYGSGQIIELKENKGGGSRQIVARINVCRQTGEPETFSIRYSLNGRSKKGFENFEKVG